MSGSPNTGRLVQSTPAPGKTGSFQALVLVERGLAIAQYSSINLWKRIRCIQEEQHLRMPHPKQVRSNVQ